MNRSAAITVPRFSRKAIATGVILGTAGVVLTYLWIRRSQAYVCPKVAGGMKVGADPALINLDARYQDEGESERDVVDQAVWESFICSDPPAY